MVATVDPARLRLVRAERVDHLAEVVARLHGGELAACGVDIPIGLPDAGSRPCDVEARRMLGRRRASVFPAPARAVLEATTYQEALVLSRSTTGAGISAQTFGIVPKVREVDSLVTPELQATLFEVHPELSFAVMAGSPMDHNKTTPAGRAQRLTVLGGALARVEPIARHIVGGSRPDDVLDAIAVAWSAARRLAGGHLRLGGQRDSRGLAMEIVA